MHTIELYLVNVYKIYSSMSEFISHFLSEVNHAIDLKAEMTSRTQILTAKQ